MKLCWIIILMAIYTLPVKAQKGIYVGAGLNFYNIHEEVVSSDGHYNFSHSGKLPRQGTLTQSIGHCGPGIHVGYRKDINNGKSTHLFTIDVQYYFNYQNIRLHNTIQDLEIKTTANYNHGFRFAFGHNFGKIHPYIITQGTLQNVTAFNSLINNNKIIYDVDDNGNILKSTLTNSGNTFASFVASFLGGFGIEVPLKNYISFNMEYVPLKPLEYGMKDVNDENNFFIHNLVVNQLQIGVRYYIPAGSSL